MIGSLLFYALYPLSLYLRRRQSVVHGTMACESFAATSRLSIESPKIPPDQRLGQNCLSTEKKEEKMSEQSSDETPDVEQLVCVSHKDTMVEAPSNMSEAQTAATGRREEEKQETPKEEDGNMHSPLAQPSPEETSNEDDDLPIISLMRELDKMESEEDPGNAAACIKHETECWDEYPHLMLPGVTNSNPKQTSLVPNAEIHRDTQIGWHFPAGPGGTEEIFCPLWQFPTMSYYPPRENNATFDEHPDPLVPFTKPSVDFTVMSYNILAQDLLEANMELYPHCPQEALDWNHRCKMLLEELQKWKPDILCLQEVQENHYQAQLFPFLTEMGYNCVYKRRTGNKTDGCATCYRSSCFSEVSVTPVEFFRPQTELLDRHNVGIVAVLRPAVYQGSKVAAKGSLLCVANTHLLFNPRRGDVKLAQLAIMLAEIHSVVKLWKDKGEHCNVILCGDFNSLPHTPLYQFITTGELDFQGLPAWMVSGQQDLSHKATCDVLRAPLWPDCLGISDSCQYVTSSEVDASHSPVTMPQASPGGKFHYSRDVLMDLRSCPLSCVGPSDLLLIPGVTDSKPDVSSRNQPAIRFQHVIRHQLDLESTYKHTLAESGAPEVTTLHSEGAATVDYIFYSPERVSDLAGSQFGCKGLKLLGCLSLLSEETLWFMEGLPSYVFPSDHLSLLAKFQLELNTAAC
ncbi:protein angel homolog 2 isoform X2 [Festucalex cinctus]